MLLKLLGRCAILNILILFVASSASAQADSALTSHFAEATTIGRIAHDATLRSTSGREVQVIPLTTGKAAVTDRLLVQGGLHGNEPGGSAFVLWLASRYARGESLLNQLGPNVAIDFLPYANPDGDVLNTRANEHGVNLNRNFGVLWGVSKENPGSASFSEAETRAIRGLFAARKYTAAVDVHGYINWVVVPSAPEQVKGLGHELTPTMLQNYRRWRGAFKQEMLVLPGYQLKTGAGLGDGGAFEDWAFWEQGVFANCLEIESPERFARSYRPDFNHLGNIAMRAMQAPMTDSFKRYEAFVYRMFVQALLIKQMPGEPSTLAGK